MARDFYTFAGENFSDEMINEAELFNLDVNGCVPYAARIAVYDDPSMTPRVVIIDPKDIHSFLEEITNTVFKLSHEQGGTIPFIIIRELVENFIHALFIQPTISILESGNEIRFSDQGPGIKHKDLALEFGTSSATPYMKRYIRGVGSGLPNVQQYMEDKGGSLTIQDNISGGTIVTIRAQRHVVDNSQNYPVDTIQQSINAITHQPFVESSLNGIQQSYQHSYPSTYQQMPPQSFQQGFAQHATPVYNTYMQTPQQGFVNQPGLVYDYPYGQPIQTPQTAQTQPVYQPMTNNTAVSPMQSQQPAYIQLSERAQRALMQFKTYQKIGPTDLSSIYNDGSTPTWTRALKELAQCGIVQKDGQKYIVTEAGLHYLNNL